MSGDLAEWTDLIFVWDEIRLGTVILDITRCFFLGVVWCRMSRHTHAYRWWFQILFIFTPSWGSFPFWQSYVSNGLVRSPTRYRWLYQAMFYTTLCCYAHHPGLSRPPLWPNDRDALISFWFTHVGISNETHSIHGTGIFTYIYHQNQPNVDR